MWFKGQLALGAVVLILSFSVFSGGALAEGSEASGLNFKDIGVHHPTLARIELLTGAYQTTPGLTISHPIYYSDPKFFGFGMTVSQFGGPATIALFAELRHLPTARSLSETFAFSLGYWTETSSVDSNSDNGFMFGFSVGFTGRAFGRDNSRFMGEIGFRFIGRPERDFDVLAPCSISLPCRSLEPQARNTSNLLFSLGLLF